MNRAIFFDRDGVLNVSEVRGGRPYAPKRLEDFVLAPGAVEVVSELKQAGFLTIVVTNQKDVGAGITDMSVVDAMHDRLRSAMPLDAIEVCTCVDECPCYKPNIGMLTKAAEEFSIDLTRSYMIGDRWRDVGAGKKAGCTTLFIDWGYDETLQDTPDHIVYSLQQAGSLIKELETR